MGGDSCSQGRGFRLPAPNTGWTFSHLFVAKFYSIEKVERPFVKLMIWLWPRGKPMNCVLRSHAF